MYVVYAFIFAYVMTHAFVYVWSHLQNLPSGAVDRRVVAVELKADLARAQVVKLKWRLGAATRNPVF